MKKLKLTFHERRALLQEIQDTKDVKILKRALALFSLDEGASPSQVSALLGTTRQSLYHWIDRYLSSPAQPLAFRLSDRSHPGRPPEKSELLLQFLSSVIEDSPRKYGYRHTYWTAPLLSQFLLKTKDLEVHPKTIRFCLEQLHYVWKRPGYALARQSPTWRQEKGASNEA